MYELLDHTADIGIRGEADDLEGLLAEAARGLMAVIVANPEALPPGETRVLDLAADDPATLLVRWLNELVYLFDTEGLLLCGCTLAAAEGGRRLHAECRTSRFDAQRHGAGQEVKAVTYHQLSAAPGVDGRWRGHVVLDI